MVPAEATQNGNHMYMDKKQGASSNFRLWQPKLVSVSVRYLTHAILSRISFNIGLYVQVLLAFLKSGQVNAQLNLTISFRTKTKLLHHSNVLSTSNDTMICCLCSLVSSSL